MKPWTLRVTRATVAANRTVAEGEVLQVPDEVSEEDAHTLLRLRKAVREDAPVAIEPEYRDPAPETRDPKPTRKR